MTWDFAVLTVGVLWSVWFLGRAQLRYNDLTQDPDDFTTRMGFE